MTQKITPQAIRSVTASIVKNYKPEKIILFGSYAWGKPKKNSDLDLLVIKSTRKKKINREIELVRHLRSVRFPIDVLVYTPTEVAHQVSQMGNIFMEDILNRGEVLYSK
jgi:predicted nucleotidyltransferase